MEVIEDCFINREFKIIFGCSPKCNSTNILAVFFDYINYPVGGWPHNDYINYSQTNMCYFNDFNDEYLKIKFTRCPYERAVSAYNHFFNFAGYNLTTFEDFLKSIKNEECIFIKKQFDSLKYDEIVKCENLENEIDRINLKYNKNFKCLTTTKTHWTNRSKIKTDDEYIGNKIINKDMSKQNYINYYNETTKTLVEEIFKEDIEHYNYTFEEFLNRNNLHYEKNLTFLYGNYDCYIDISEKVYNLFMKNNKINITIDNGVLTNYFSDPLQGHLKHIKVIDKNNNHKIFNEDISNLDINTIF